MYLILEEKWAQVFLKCISLKKTYMKQYISLWHFYKYFVSFVSPSAHPFLHYQYFSSSHSSPFQYKYFFLILFRCVWASTNLCSLPWFLWNINGNPYKFSSFSYINIQDRLVKVPVPGSLSNGMFINCISIWVTSLNNLPLSARFRGVI